MRPDLTTPASSATLTLDVGGTTTRAALWDGVALRERVQRPTPQPATPDAVIAGVLDLIRPLLGKAGRVGVACTGSVARGWVTAGNQVTFPGWVDVDLQGRLAAETGLPCTVLNDARAAAWGEFALGGGAGASEFMFVTVSTGVGAGLVLDGRLHLARNGLDAELGFTFVPAQLSGGVAVPGLGLLAPLEFESSGTALGAAAAGLGLASARELADAAEAGNERVGYVYGRSAALVAWRAADVAALLGVTRVALGGSVGLRSGYLGRVQAALEVFPERYRPVVVRAQLGEDAGLIGAALWAEGLNHVTLRS